jgi:hypothetical protein
VRVFLDANLLFAGAYRSASNVDLLIEVAPARKLSLLTCDYAAGEARRNIEAKVPNRLPASADSGLGDRYPVPDTADRRQT